MLKFMCFVSFALVCAIGAQHKPHSPHTDHHHGTTMCEYIAKSDCSIFAQHILCATDAKTYHSKCEFSKAHCIYPDLHVSHNGTCDPSVVKPDPNIHGNDLIYQFFCANLKHQKCGTDLEILCGTDLITYDNVCLFEQARCSNVELAVHTYQACP